jgi:hypothetical protein
VGVFRVHFAGDAVGRKWPARDASWEFWYPRMVTAVVGPICQFKESGAERALVK